MQRHGRRIVQVTGRPSSTAHLDCGRRTARGSTRWLAGELLRGLRRGRRLRTSAGTDECLDADNTWFTLLTQNTAAPHVDHHYAAQTEFGRPLVNSTFTFALVNGQSVNDISYNVIANLGWDKVRLPNPVFSGDTIYSRSEILDTRESRSRAEAGIVTVRTTGFNHEGVEVISFKRTVMVYRRARRPSTPRLEPPGTA